MITSVAHKIYDFVLEKLNENTQGITFNGNYVFKFWPQPSKLYQDFHILEENEKKAEFDAIKVVPFVEVSNVEIPFNEKNERSDREVEYYLAVRIGNNDDDRSVEFDFSDPKYQAILETYKVFKDTLTFTTDDMRVGFKAREPQKVNIFKYNGAFYQMFALTFNISSIKFGRFGNEAKLYLGEVDDPDFGVSNESDYYLDTAEWTLIMSKDEHNATKTEALNRRHRILDRTIEIQATINYDEDTPANQMLMDEIIASTFNGEEETNEKEYKLRILQNGSFDKTFNVYVSTGNISFKPTTPETYMVSFKSKGE